MINPGPTFDHLGLWCSTLETSAERFGARIGVTPQGGGRHDGQGTWNRLVGAGPGQYLELIGIDPTQTARGPIASRSEGLADLTPCLLAFRHADLDAIAEQARVAGCQTPGPFSMQRADQNGGTLAWRIVFIEHPDHPLLPFFIDWQQSPHPSEQLGEGVRIGPVSMSSPDPAGLSGVLGALGLLIETRYSAKPGIHVVVDGPGGSLRS